MLPLKNREENDVKKDKEEQVTKIAAAIKESQADLTLVATADEKSCSIARNILGITTRKSR